MQNISSFSPPFLCKIVSNGPWLLFLARRFRLTFDLDVFGWIKLLHELELIKSVNMIKERPYFLLSGNTKRWVQQTKPNNQTNHTRPCIPVSYKNHFSHSSQLQESHYAFLFLFLFRSSSNSSIFLFCSIWLSKAICSLCIEKLNFQSIKCYQPFLKGFIVKGRIILHFLV